MLNRFSSVLLSLTLAAAAFAADSPAPGSPEFAKLLAPGAKVEKLAGGFKFLEGPAWLDFDGGCVIFSDIPNNRLIKWTKKDGATVFRAESNQANGNARDADGRLVSCEHATHCISRTEKDGKITILADKHDGKALNSPNDLAIKSDGTIWFTDPSYGLGKRKKEQAGNYVYRLDPKTGQVSAVAKDFDMPNGIAFSPDEKKLYVADSGKPKHIRVFEVKADGTLEGGTVFCKIDKGSPDGIRCDGKGRVWSSAGDGVQVFSPDGTLMGKILTPESVSNLCFGGAEGRTLFMTGRAALYAITVNAD